MKSKKSEIEIQMEDVLKECEDIVDDNYLRTQDARMILDAGYKLLHKCEELRKSRDLAITRREEWEDKFRELKDSIKAKDDRDG